MARTWMLQHGNLLAPSEGDPKHLEFSDCEILENGLGGSLVRVGDAAGSFVGINIRCAKGKTAFLPRMLIRECLEQYQILTLRDLEGDDDSEKEDVEGSDDSGQEDVEGGDDSGQEETEDTSTYGVGFMVLLHTLASYDAIYLTMVC
ncbi:uncharacterized protein [Triticum aestivum]|uniref:uncharacterized protein n=1 Tax=Triticum aestivum TaxID=4565 RepID=UPI001D02B27D|nr:uncharacterized protein LOC123081098 [Triticum aestivum]